MKALILHIDASRRYDFWRIAVLCESNLKPAAMLAVDVAYAGIPSP